MDQAIVSNEFLNRFTEEILLNLRKRKEEQQSSRLEEERRERAIAVEKFRRKFPVQSNNILNNRRQLNPKIIQPFRQNQTQVNKPLVKLIPQVISQQPQKQIQVQQKPQQNNALQIQRRLVQQQMTAPKRELPILRVDNTLSNEKASLGKLASLVRDSGVTFIECVGENKDIVVRKVEGVFATHIQLSKEEIVALVESFSEKARIPIIGGLLNARVGNLELSANLSDNTSSSFILSKAFVPQALPNFDSKTFSPSMPMKTRALPSDPSEFEQSIMHPESRE